MLESTQIVLVSILQIIIAIGLINVWIVRFHKPTRYRGRGAGNMEQEFHAYGLPTWFMYVVGGMKLIIAGLMIIGLWRHTIVYPIAWALVGLMVGAIAMHIKVRDPLMRTLPAIGMLLMAVGIIVLGM